MKRTHLMNVLVASAVFLTFSLIGVQTSEAVEAHHQPGTQKSAPATSESPGSGTMPDSVDGSGPGMMGMMSMMGSSDDESDQGMMGMMDKGMMRMMMAHMTGGPGGMGKMMGKMGSGMKSRGSGPGGMTRMLENLDLTPEQWDQVRSLARERLDKMADLWVQRMKLRIELASLRWDKKIDAQQVKALFVKKAEAKAETFLAGLTYIRELKAILTPEQINQLEAQGL